MSVAFETAADSEARRRAFSRSPHSASGSMSWRARLLAIKLHQITFTG